MAGVASFGSNAVESLQSILGQAVNYGAQGLNYANSAISSASSTLGDVKKGVSQANAGVQSAIGNTQAASANYDTAVANLTNAQTAQSNAEANQQYVKDQGATISNYLDTATSLADVGTGLSLASLNNLSGIYGAAGGTQTALNNMGLAADDLYGVASALLGQAGQIGNYANTFNALGQNLESRAGTFDALGNKIISTADSLQTDYSKLAALGDEMWSQGNAAVTGADAQIGILRSLGNLDWGNAGTLGREYQRLYNSLGPEFLANQAGADVQTQSDSAYQQQMRDVARRGGSVTGGNALALQKQYKVALATAKAAAMTNARVNSVAAQKELLKQIADVSSQGISSETGVRNSGVSQQAAAESAMKDAAAVKNYIGSLYSSAGEVFGLGTQSLTAANTAYGNAEKATADAATVTNLAGGQIKDAASIYDGMVSGGKTLSDIYAQAGSLTDTAAARLGSLSGVYSGAADTTNSYLSTLNTAQSTTNAAVSNTTNATGEVNTAMGQRTSAQSAYNSALSVLQSMYGTQVSAAGNLTSAYGLGTSASNNAANTALNAAKTEVSANTSGGGGGSSSASVATTSADPWEATGHTATWWLNNDPAAYAQLARDFGVAAVTPTK